MNDVTNRTAVSVGYSGCVRRLEVNNRIYDFSVPGYVVEGVNVGRYPIQSFHLHARCSWNIDDKVRLLQRNAAQMCAESSFAKMEDSVPCRLPMRLSVYVLLDSQGSTASKVSSHPLHCIAAYVIQVYPIIPPKDRSR